MVYFNNEVNNTADAPFLYPNCSSSLIKSS